MPSIKSNFSLNYADISLIQKKILQFGIISEDIINDYIHHDAAIQIINAITKEIPKSDKGKKHAKDNIWYEQENFNLAVGISNNMKGKRGTSFYYLYYVVTGTGNSKKNGANDFMERGLDKEYPKLVDGIIAQLENM